MGFLRYLRAVWWRALKDAWDTAVRHTWASTARSAFLVIVSSLVMVAANERLHIVDRGLMSADNIKDNAITLLIFVPIAILLLFALWFLVEGVFLVPYKMWKEAVAALPRPPPSVAPQGVFPDWQLSELLTYLRPDLPVEPQAPWMPTVTDVEDRFATGQLEAWARKRLSGSASRPSLEKVDPTYWKDADILLWSANPIFARGVHTRRRSFKTEWEYLDVRVNKAQALAIWPTPLATPKSAE